jgi:hypothetical protein
MARSFSGALPGVVMPARSIACAAVFVAAVEVVPEAPKTCCGEGMAMEKVVRYPFSFS